MVKIVKLIVKYHTHSKSRASPEVWEEMSSGDMSTAGEGSIVAGIGVDVDIALPTPSGSEKHRRRSLPV